MNKPFYIYDFMALTCSAQFSKIKLRATCFWLREAFCKDRLCLYPHIWNTRIIFQQGVEGFLQNSYQIDSFRKETAYVAGMCWEPLIKRLKTSWWLSQAAWQCKGVCREQSQVVPPSMWDEMMTGDGNLTHHPQKTEVLAFWFKKKIIKKNKTTLGSYFSITLSSSLLSGVTLPANTQAN